MAEEAKINYYKVHRCGYHARGIDNEVFGGLAKIIPELIRWAFDGNKLLADTCSYGVLDGDNNLRTFCFDHANAKNGDVILVTWNETQAVDGRTVSVNGGEPAGEASVESRTLPKGHIPGYPTYFWFIPDMRIFSTIRFGQVLNGHSGLKMLMSGFLETFTSHVIINNDVDGNEIEIFGYSANGKMPAVNVHPQFRTSHLRLPGPIDFIRVNRHRIKKVIRKTVLSGEKKADIGYFGNILNEFGVIDIPDDIEDIKVKTEIPFSPSERQLEQLLDAWEGSPESSWTDVGFEVTGETETFWLSHALVKSEIILNVDRDEHGVISADSIMAEVQANRAHLLSVMG